MNTLQKTRVTVPLDKVSFKRGHRLQWQRRVFQCVFIAALVLIPLSGLFRIDPLAGAFVVADRQIWFSDFFLVFGLWMMLSCALVVLYSLVGTAFCGWACPQNSLSEWANYLTRRWLGRWAKVELDGSAPQVAGRKNTVINWTVLGGVFLVTAMLFALLPLVYFYTPSQLWSFVTLHPDPSLGGSWYWIYTVFVLIIFLDIAFIRHFWCRFMCIYKVWQHTFKTQQTLKLHYDKSRAADCEKCQYCVQACFLDLDPRQTDIYDSCVNCGACIVACDKMHSKQAGQGLLSFQFGGEPVRSGRWLQGRLSSMFSRVHWTLPIFGLGCGFFIWGMLSYSPLHASVYRADGDQRNGIHAYTIHIANKLYGPTQISLSVQGLPEGSYRLQHRQVTFSDTGRMDIQLNLSGDLPPGLYPFKVLVHAPGDDLILEATHFAGNKHG